MDRALLAVYSFYREDPELLRGLDPLWACRVSRGWGSLRIECRDRVHRAVVCAVVDLLRPPLEALAVVREIRLLVPGEEPLVFPVSVPFKRQLLAYDGSIGD
ncbi:MAG: hypothetical protein FJ056_02770 [Cyanobacteria bacterium M_surface_10_m2_179]|nr:hypothetical protein [Cyanobacteria bacterium M_surface_10_m2_179]